MRKHYTKGLQVILVSLAFSLDAMAEQGDTIWQHSIDRYTPSAAIDITGTDSIVFKKNAMRVFYTSEDGSVTYKNLAYLSSTNKTYDGYTLTRPGKAIYKPAEMRSMDWDDPSSKYCFERSMESENCIVFWEAGFGKDPTKATGSYKFNPTTLLKYAEEIYKKNRDVLKFVEAGHSNSTDNYKLLLMVLYQTDWLATGSGYDNKVGAFWCNPDAINDKSTLAHELGHSFQYMVACDLGTNHGWRYGFGTNASGGCAWWEACAQWQAFMVYPEYFFSNYYYSHYIDHTERNILEEDWRYADYFIQCYWVQKHGLDFLGKLWRESVRPEDPVETYKRITGIDQETFNDEFFEFASQTTSWDIDCIRTYGKNQINAIKQHVTQDSKDKYLWRPQASYCPQNYGYNVIQLKNSGAGQVIKANFKGIAGADGYRAVKVEKAGWRYGFCAYKTDGTRVYGEMGRDPEGTIEFTIPTGTKYLWFVVSGAPTEHWRHPWNDDTSDDEQWPYEVQFENTNRYGY